MPKISFSSTALLGNIPGELLKSLKLSFINKEVFSNLFSLSKIYAEHKVFS